MKGFHGEAFFWPLTFGKKSLIMRNSQDSD